MSKPKILSLMPIPNEMTIDFIKPGIDLTKVEITSITPKKASEEQICEAVKDAKVIIGDYSAENYISSKVIEAAKECCHIQFGSIGYEGIDLKAATQHGITVSNGFDDGVAVSEHTIMLILMLLRKAVHAHNSTSQGQWLQFEIAPYVEPFNEKTLGILGLGTIGTQVAIRARAFGSRVIYYKRNRLTPEDEKKLGVAYRSFHQLLKESDILTIHVPLTDETRKLIGERELSQMKDGAYLINTARRDVVDEFALAKAVKIGKLAGVGVDYEPIDLACPLRGLDNVVLMPHFGGVGSSKKSELESSRRLGQNISKAIFGGTLDNVVNVLTPYSK